MNLTRKISAIALLGLITLAAACSFNVSTAKIGDFKLGKDKEISQPTTTFETTDAFYSATKISMNPGTVKVKGSLHIVEVEGQKAGPVPGAEMTVDMPGEGTATINFTPPPNGWPSGKYKFEVQMLNEDGEQKDSKSQELTVN